MFKIIIIIIIKNHGSGTAALIIQMKRIMKIFKSIEESRLLVKRISETIENERKE